MMDFYTSLLIAAAAVALVFLLYVAQRNGHSAARIIAAVVSVLALGIFWPEAFGALIGLAASIGIVVGVMLLVRGFARWLTGTKELEREIARLRAEQADHYRSNRHEW